MSIWGSYEILEHKNFSDRLIRNLHQRKLPDTV